MTYPQPAPGALPGWRFPDGTVLVKTFSLETETGQEAARLETRLLHRRARRRHRGVRRPGLERLHLHLERRADRRRARRREGRRPRVHDQDRRPARRKQNVALPQPGRMHPVPHDDGQVRAGRQHAADEPRPRLRRRGRQPARDARAHRPVRPASCPQPPEKLAKLADYRDAKADLDARARAYLHANCSHCHRKWGGGNAEFQLLATLPLKDTGHRRRRSRARARST